MRALEQLFDQDAKIHAFREADEGAFKASTAARAARNIYPEIDARSIDGNLLADVGLNHFRWANVIIGALDNREARVFVNSACARVRLSAGRLRTQ